ncbi:MAG TPA: MFS transporter, partial [Erythrobacter sp.]|nr:MFS transporter [Erythrobacter sp.]
ALIGAVTLIALRLRLPNDEPQFAARGSAYESPYSGSPTSEVAEEASDDDEDEDYGPEPGKLRWF